MMEITIELTEEFFDQGQTITFRQEDPQLPANNLANHHHHQPTEIL